jgi:hypothetical protein
VVADPSSVAALNARIRAARAQLVRTMDEHAAEMDAVYAELAGRRRGRA